MCCTDLKCREFLAEGLTFAPIQTGLLVHAYFAQSSSRSQFLKQALRDPQRVIW